MKASFMKVIATLGRECKELMPRLISKYRALFRKTAETDETIISTDGSVLRGENLERFDEHLPGENFRQ